MTLQEIEAHIAKAAFDGRETEKSLWLAIAALYRQLEIKEITLPDRTGKQ